MSDSKARHLNYDHSSDIRELRKNYLIRVFDFEIISLSIIGFLWNIFLLSRGTPKFTNNIYLFIALISIIFSRIFAKKRRLEIAWIINFLILWMISSLFIIRSSSFISAGFPVIFLLIYISYLILGKKAGNFSFVLMMTTIVFTSLNQKFLWISHNQPRTSLLIETTIRFISLIAIALLAIFSTTILENSMKQANESELKSEELKGELEVAHEQINQAQKMDAIARMAGGLSHDFNNLLTAIIGNIEISLSEENITEIYQNLLLMKSAAEKASVLSRELLTFSRHRVLDPQVCSLNDIIEKNKSFVRSLIRKDISVRYNLSSRINMINLDVEKFEQTYYNLLLNAHEAITGPGEIIITTYNKAVLSNSDDTTSMTCISIKDNGVGMDQDILDHMFEPFFTTKDSGTGIGLSTVYAFVAQSEGKIKVTSSPGQGTEVFISFPSIDKLAPKVKVVGNSSSIGLNNGSAGSKYNLVIVDDEEMIVNAIEKYLRRKKILTTSFHSPVEALRYIEQSDNIDLIITDQVMPEMSGLELISKVIKIQPNMKFLIISGYVNDLEGLRRLNPELIDRKQIDFVQKPFEFKFLLSKIEELVLMDH